MKKRRCLGCGVLFHIRPQVPHQSYCSNNACQRKRQQEWQRKKLRDDPDHRENRDRAQRAWSERNPDYWRSYRDSHPDYVASNRLKQQERDARLSKGELAKNDVSNAESILRAGVYDLKILPSGSIVKSDVLTVEISIHICSEGAKNEDCKDRT